MKRVLGNISCDLDQKVKKMYFLVNASSLQLQTLQVDRSHCEEGTGQYFMLHMYLDAMVKGQIKPKAQV